MGVNFSFPEAGWLLLALIPLLYAQFALHRHRMRQQRVYASPLLLSRLMIPRSTSLSFAKTVGWGVIWTLLCVALMGPFRKVSYVPTAADGRGMDRLPEEVILLVDTSPSMRVPDGVDGQTRLEQAKAIVEEIVRQLHGQMVSLYTFDSSLHAIVPPTVDYLFMRLAIHALRINQQAAGTWLAPVLKGLQMKALLHPSHTRYTLVMITDGGDTRKESQQEILQALPLLGELPLRLLVVGVGGVEPQPIPHVSIDGKPVMSQLEPVMLKALAEKGKGRYENARDWNSWTLARALMDQIEEAEEIAGAVIPTTLEAKSGKGKWHIDSYYQIPVGIAVIFYCLNFLLPDTQRS